MKLLYASDYDAQHHENFCNNLSFYDNQRNKFHNNEKDGIYKRGYFRYGKLIIEHRDYVKKKCKDNYKKNKKVR